MLHIFFICLISTLLLRLLALICLRGASAPTRLRKRVFAVGVSILFALVSLEVALHFAVVRSDFFGFTYAAQRWWDVHWGEENEFGYRDQSFAPKELGRKKLVIMLGDSIVAGQGIDRREDRASNLLATSLGDSWRVLNVARCGWDTQQELAALRRHLSDSAEIAQSTKTVILLYYPNDILGVLSSRNALESDLAFPRPPALVAGLTNSSALFSLVYWRLFSTFNQELGSRYWRALAAGARDSDLWGLHQTDLRNLHAEAARDGRTFVLVSVPTLPDFSVGAEISGKVEALFLGLGVPVIRLSQELRGWSTSDLVANPWDFHPSAKVHAHIAKRAFDVLGSRLEIQ